MSKCRLKEASHWRRQRDEEPGTSLGEEGRPCFRPTKFCVGSDWLQIVPFQGGEVPPGTFQHAPARGGKPDMRAKRTHHSQFSC